jgi:hypothetical protein
MVPETTVGCVTVTLVDLVQVCESVTVTVYVPTVKLDALAVEAPFDHK